MGSSSAKLTGAGHRSTGFGQGRLEAGQSKHTRTPPLAAERLAAAIASWQHTKGRHQLKNRPSNAKSASEIPALAADAGYRDCSCLHASGPPESGA